MKTCTKCGVEKPKTEFCARRSCKDGLQSWCRECKKVARKAWYLANTERHKAAAKAWYEANLERSKTAMRALYEANAECRRAAMVAWRKVNRFTAALAQSRRNAKRLGYIPCTATVEEIEAAFTERCHNPKCGVPEAECARRLHLDHDHKTGEFRGWLCGRCNLKDVFAEKGA